MLVWHRKNIQPWNTPRRKLQHNSVLPSKVSIFNNQLKGMECNTVSIKIVLSYKLHLISKFYKMKTTFIDLMSQRCFYEFTWTVNAQSKKQIHLSSTSSDWVASHLSFFIVFKVMKMFVDRWIWLFCMAVFGNIALRLFQFLYMLGF